MTWYSVDSEHKPEVDYYDLAGGIISIPVLGRYPAGRFSDASMIVCVMITKPNGEMYFCEDDLDSYGTPSCISHWTYIPEFDKNSV